MAGARIVPCPLRRTWPVVWLALAALGTAPLWGQVSSSGPPVPGIAPNPAAPNGAPYAMPPLVTQGGLPQGPALQGPIAQGLVPQGSPPLGAGPVPTDETVVDVRVVGNRVVSLAKIVPNIRTRPGRPFDRQLIEEDVRRLNKTRMFVNVRTYSRHVEGGQVVIFEVIERPILEDLEIIGCRKINAKTLKKQLDIKKGDACDPFAVEEARRKLDSYYHEKGYSNAQVTILEGNRPEDRRARFLVSEGPKQKILKVVYVGNTIASGGRLSTQIGSRPAILWLFGGEVDHKKIAEDINKLTAYYRSLGFFQAKVGRMLQFNAERDWLTLTFVISEGPRYRIRNLSVSGNSKFSTEDLTKDRKLKPGQFFDQGQMLADTVSMQDKYGAIGYVFADVKAHNSFLEEPGQLDVVYNITEGDRYVVRRINIKISGENAHTKITTVLNRLSIRPGDVVNIKELRASERRLQFSGLFENKQGEKPKIVFSPPDKQPGDDSSSNSDVADKPRRPKFRSQGPDDDSPADARAQPASACAGRDRVVDLELQGVLKPPSQWPPSALERMDAAVVTPPSPAAADHGLPPDTQPQPNAGTPPPPGGATWQDIRQTPDSSLAAAEQQLAAALAAPPHADPPAAAAAQVAPPLWPLPPRRRQPMIVRAQYTPGASPDGSAVSVPYTSDVPNYSLPAGPSAGSGYSNTLPPSNYPQTPPAATGYSRPAYSNPAYSNPGYSGPGYSGMQAPGGYQPPAQPPAGAYGQPGSTTWSPGGAAGTGSGGAPSLMPAPAQPGAEQVFPRPGDADFVRPLDIDVLAKETQTGRIMFGVGVNSDAGLVGNVTVDEQNFDWTRWPESFEDVRNATAFRGNGEHFRLELQPGTLVQRYTVSWAKPYVWDSEANLSLSGYYFNRIYNEWSEERVGGSIGLGYQLNHDLMAQVGFTAEAVGVSNPAVDSFIGAVPEPIADVVGFSTRLAFQQTIAHDTRDNQFLATEGHRFAVTFQEVVGTYDYPSVDVSFRQYFLLHQRADGSGRHTLTLGARFDVTADNTPVYDRFYAGGFATLRGFDFRGVSPVSPGGIHLGGDAMVLLSAEYLFPITADDTLRGVLFCDTGTVEPSLREWTDNYRIAPGAGLRISVPMMGPAPIALDLAFPVSVNPGDRVLNFSFNVGFQR